MKRWTSRSVGAKNKKIHTARSKSVIASESRPETEEKVINSIPNQEMNLKKEHGLEINQHQVM